MNTLRLTVLLHVVAIIVLFRSVPALAAGCTHEDAVRAISVLNDVAALTLPDAVADLGPDAGIPYIETLLPAELALQLHNVTAAHNWADVLRYALQGRCGDALVDAEPAQAKALVDQFDPWLVAWTDAFPKERVRRATDASEAVAICELQGMLADAQAAIAREKANSSGVVDLNYLHTEGQMAQAYAQMLSSRTKVFAADRKKAFPPALCRAKR